MSKKERKAEKKAINEEIANLHSEYYKKNSQLQRCFVELDKVILTLKNDPEMQSDYAKYVEQVRKLNAVEHKPPEYDEESNAEYFYPKITYEEYTFDDYLKKIRCVEENVKTKNQPINERSCSLSLEYINMCKELEDKKRTINKRWRQINRENYLRRLQEKV